MIHQVINDDQFDIQWIGCDAAFGNDHKLLNALSEDKYFFAGIHENERIYRQWPLMEQPEDNQPSTGRKRKYPRPKEAPEMVKDVANDETIPWQNVYLCEGSKGPIIAEVTYIRCVRCETLTKKHNYLVPIVRYGSIYVNMKMAT